MKWVNRGSVFLLCAVSAGCAGSARPAPVAGSRLGPPAEAEAVAASDRAAAPASALVFDPPVTLGLPPLQLSREGREPSAFVGFDGPIIERYTVFTDDRQVTGYGYGGSCGSDSSDRYERRAFTERSGVRFR